MQHEEMQPALKSALNPTQGTRQRYLRLATLNAELARRTDFWRALAEMLAVSHLFCLLTYGISYFPGSPWAEIASFLIYPLIGYGAWRLAPGRGGWLRRGLRVLAWAALYGSICGTIGWWILERFPYPGRLYGMRPELLHLPFGTYLLNLLLITFSIVLPARVLLALWGAAQRRLRWLLTFSYVLVGVLTIVFVPVTYSLFFGLASLWSAPVFAAPEATARRLAQAFELSVRASIAPGELNPTLEDLLAGRAHLPVPVEQTQAEIENFNDFAGVRRVTLVGESGIILASAGRDPFGTGGMLPAAQRVDWRLVLDQARATGCVDARPGDGPLPDTSACPIIDASGAPLATLVVENTSEAQAQWGAAFGRVIGIVLLGSSFTLILALPLVTILLLVALGIGLLIARRLSRRLELLAQASGDIAAGNLARRVEVDRNDEIGQLGADFNAMASRLEEREHALGAAADRSDALLQLNRRLVANVSHELRTPLATLRGYVEALEQDYGDTLPAHDLTVIHGEIERLTALIDDLFTLARAEARQLPLIVDAVDVAAMIRRLVDTLAPLARRDRQIELVCALPTALPLVRADRVWLEQVFLNLAQNALRHTPPGGIVAFEGAAHAESVQFTVADTGLGIAPEELPLIFERFYRSDASRARETGGAGLGLALVHELVGAMGGSISAESVPGRGSRFTVALQRV